MLMEVKKELKVFILSFKYAVMREMLNKTTFKYEEVMNKPTAIFLISKEENNYINKLIESLNFSDDEIKKFFTAIQKILNMYTERKIGDLNVRQEI